MIDLDTQMYEVRARVHHLGGLFWVCGSAALVEVVLLRGEGRAKKALAVALQRRYAQIRGQRPYCWASVMELIALLTALLQIDSSSSESQEGKARMLAKCRYASGREGGICLALG
jgi:hypothetical protein